MRFWVYNDEVSFRMCKVEKQPMELQVRSIIDVEDTVVNDGYIEDPTWKYKEGHAMMIN